MYSYILVYIYVYIYPHDFGSLLFNALPAVNTRMSHVQETAVANLTTEAMAIPIGSMGLIYCTYICHNSSQMWLVP